MIDLKSERVQEELAAAPDDDAIPELKSERVQEPAAARIQPSNRKRH